jgi:hypothetical protein
MVYIFITIRNYNSLTDLQALKINVTTAHANAFTGRCKVTAPNNGYPSASVLTSLPVGDCLTINYYWSVR